jgi:hypothetical protein
MMRLSILTALVLTASTADARRAPPVYQKQALPVQNFASPMDFARSLTGEWPESLEGDQNVTIAMLNAKKPKPALLVRVTVGGLLDDSVKAEDWNATLVKVDGDWKVTGLEKRWQCYRNGNPEQWTIKPCP